MHGTKINYNAIEPYVVGHSYGYSVYISAIQVAKYYNQPIKRVNKLIRKLGEDKYTEMKSYNPFTPNTLMVNSTALLNNIFAWFDDDEKSRELFIFMKYEKMEIAEEIKQGILHYTPIHPQKK